MSTLKNLIILCGHYKGVDERVREHLITRRSSLGIMCSVAVNFRPRC